MMDYSQRGATGDAIVQLMADGVARGIDEIQRLIGHSNRLTVSTTMTRLCDSGDLERLPRAGQRRGDAVLFRQCEAKKPFLLGLVCRGRLDAGVVA